jgi:hypothetical protein
MMCPICLREHASFWKVLVMLWVAGMFSAIVTKVIWDRI